MFEMIFDKCWYFCLRSFSSIVRELLAPSRNHAKIIFRWSGQKQISKVLKFVFVICWGHPRTILGWCLDDSKDFLDFLLWEVSQVIFADCWPSTTHEKTCLQASLKPQGPRDRACGKEREIRCRIALTRALYDQMAPQLYPFYVPGNSEVFDFFVSDLVSFWRFSPLSGAR